METKPDEFAQFKELVAKYDSFIFDFDGTLWQSNTPIDAGFKALDHLKSLGKKTYFITNTSSYTRETYKQKLEKFGFSTDIQNIYGSAYVTLKYLQQNYPDITIVYAVGLKGLKEELELGGIKVIGAHEDNDKEMNSHIFASLRTEPDIGAVVCGWDIDINYYKMCYASLCLQSGAAYIATNIDPYDSIGGRHLPAAGAMVSSIGFAAEKTPIVVGKPNPFVIDLIKKEHGANDAKIIMIGDRVDSDILLGINAGIDTLLVLTGVTNEGNLTSELKKLGGKQPTYISKSLVL